MTTPRLYLDVFSISNRLYSGATVTVKKESDDTDATLYAAESGTATLLNPQTLGTNGKWAQPVYVDEPVYLSIVSVTVPDHTTGIFRPAPYNRHADTTANRPTLAATDDGYPYFDTTLGTPIWWDGTGWVDATGAAA